jgi:hypothetical protein
VFLAKQGVRYVRGMRYFDDYREALEPGDIHEASLDGKPPDAGGDELPFGHLEDRRFEILVYRLKCAEMEDRNHHVRLMQGGRERGRDVIVYTAEGALAEIVQCKIYRDRIPGPQVLRELVKIALHAYLDPTLLGVGPIDHELWCPGGLTETAAKLFDAWPTTWTEAALAPEAAKVLAKYAAFDELEWETVRDFVVTTFSARIRPSTREGVAITTLVRQNISIYEAFFQGTVVMKKEQVAGALEDVIRRVMAEKEHYLNDADARHILDRIVSFSPEERLVSNSSIVLGLRPELVSRFRRDEYLRFAKHLVEGLYGLINIVMSVCARIQSNTGGDSSRFSGACDAKEPESS